MPTKYKNITVLLTDGGDRQTLPLARAFHELGCKVAALNASKLDNGYVSRYVDEKILEPCIKKSKNYHGQKIKELILTGKYDVAVTTSDDTAEQLSLMKEEIKGKTKITVADPELFYMAYDKNQTMRVCMENDIPCPKTYLNISKIEDIPFDQLLYPLVVKPRKSYGAIGYHQVNNKKELMELCQKIQLQIEQYVFQEYIPQTDIQYECAMFIDRNNEVKTACVFSKNRWFPVSGGSSTCNVTVDRPDIQESCARLLQKLQWRGAADIDLIQDPRDGKAKIMEINPRVSGSIKVVFQSGVNIAQQILQLALEEPVSEYKAYKKDIRLRCVHTDFLWFVKSPHRFHTDPNWFSWKNTTDQIFSWKDPLPFFTFSVQALGKYKREMEKRKR